MFQPANRTPAATERIEQPAKRTVCITPNSILLDQGNLPAVKKTVRAGETIVDPARVNHRPVQEILKAAIQVVLPIILVEETGLEKK